MSSGCEFRSLSDDIKEKPRLFRLWALDQGKIALRRLTEFLGGLGFRNENMAGEYLIRIHSAGTPTPLRKDFHVSLDAGDVRGSNYVKRVGIVSNNEATSQRCALNQYGEPADLR